MRLTALLASGLLATGWVLQAQDTPTPPAAGIGSSANPAVDDEAASSNPRPSLGVEPDARSHEVENTAEEEAAADQGDATTPTPEGASDPEDSEESLESPSATAADCAPRILTGGPIMVNPTIAVCSPWGCGPFGPPPLGDAPGPGTGVAVPPIPPAYLAPIPPRLAPGPVHDRYPYYSYRRPWYTAGPASANVTIVW